MHPYLSTLASLCIVAVLLSACAGTSPDPTIAARMLSEFHLSMPEQPRIEPLTESEMAVLRLVARGVENEHIAQALNYSVYTVANRLRTIYEKLRVTNRT